MSTTEVSQSTGVKVSMTLKVALASGFIGISAAFAVLMLAEPGASTESTKPLPIAHQWAKAIGGPDWDIGKTVAQDEAGNVYVAGMFRGTVDFDPGSGTDSRTANNASDIFVTKLNANGTYSWTVTIQDPGEEDRVGGLFIPKNQSDHVYVSGWSVGRRAFVRSLNATSGLEDRAWKIEGTATEMSIQDVTLDADGNILYAGAFNNGFGMAVDFDPGPGIDLHGSAKIFGNIASVDAFVTKLAPDGSYQWTKTFGEGFTDKALSIETDPHTGNIIIAGLASPVFFVNESSAPLSPSPAEGDASVFVLAPNGDYRWGRIFGGFDWDEIKNVVVDGDGNIYLAGGYSGTVNFNPFATIDQPEADVRTSVNNSIDAFVTKLMADGSYAWTRTLGDSGTDVSFAVAVDDANNPYVLGSFQGSVDFDPSSAVDRRSSTNETTFLTSYSLAGQYLGTDVLENGTATGTYNRPADISWNAKTRSFAVTGEFFGTVDLNLDPATELHTSQGNNPFYPDIYIMKAAFPSRFTPPSRPPPVHLPE